MIKAVSFDCAQTLLEVRWNPVEVAMEAARIAEVEFRPASQHDRLMGPQPAYGRLFGERQEDWRRACCRHDLSLSSGQFWSSLTHDWLKQFGQEVRTDDVIASAEKVLYGPESRCFLPMPGAIETVQTLKSLGLKVIVLSNWDDSLVKVLTHCGLAGLFDEIFASLVEGCEKPEPEFFDLAHQALGCRKEEVLHVGDNPLDDAVGAINFGWRALLLRSDLAAGPWDLNAESKNLMHRLRPGFVFDPWPPCFVVDRLSDVAAYVQEEAS